MTESPIRYLSLNLVTGVLVIGTALSLLGGYWAGSTYVGHEPMDFMAILLWFLGIPVLATLIGAFLGWKGKQAVEYNSPEWKFEPIQLKPEECKSFARVHNRNHTRLVASGNFWFFFIPVLLILAMFGLPLWMQYETHWLAQYAALLEAAMLALVYLTSFAAMYFGSANSASEDFTMPLVREAAWLARKQSKVPGISHIRVVVDAAEVAGLHVYRNPRVIARISGHEKDAYIESWSEEVGAITKMLCRLYPSDTSPQVLLWWFSGDRRFRKYVGDDEGGYYVRNPIPSHIKELGVKDVKLVTENAVGLILLESLRIRGDSEAARETLSNLGIAVE
ncbi:MAG: hypothetical protein ACTSPR_02640 [Candidatus Thorarchaeota archaeon]